MYFYIHNYADSHKKCCIEHTNIKFLSSVLQSVFFSSFADCNLFAVPLEFTYHILHTNCHYESFGRSWRGVSTRLSSRARHLGQSSADGSFWIFAELVQMAVHLLPFAYAARNHILRGTGTICHANDDCRLRTVSSKLVESQA